MHLILFLIAVLTISCSNEAPAPNLAAKPATGLSITPATGAEIAQAIKNTEANAILVNVWATWCAPCVEEFPDIMKLYRTYKDQGLRIVFISADFEDPPKAAEAFLKDHGVDFPTFIKSGRDMAFINALDPNWSGALPATWVYDGSGKKHHFWEGKVSYEVFEEKVLSVLQKP